MVQELLDDEFVSMTKIEELWAALPKMYMDKEDKEKEKESKGIGVDAFVALNTAIEDLISTFDAGDP
jgi:hypothetical protein